MPKVSIIMPSYNKEKHISEAIVSILNQTYGNWELIIIDDVSSDNSLNMIRSFADERIRFVQNRANMGIAKTRNVGLDMAQGEYIALLDADDVALPCRLQTEVCFLDTHPDIDVVFGNFDEIDEYGRVKGKRIDPIRKPEYVRAWLMIQNVIPNCSCMYRKRFVDKHNIRYRDDYWGMDDYLFWVECSLAGRISGIPETVYYWRNYETNSTTLYTCSDEYREKRKKRFAEIQALALRGNGFVLNDFEQELYHKVLAEEKYHIQSENELEEFYALIKYLCRQASSLENAAKFRKVFGRAFGRALENARIW